MGKLSVDIIEDNYLNKSAAAANNLSILIGVDRFAYLVSTPDHQVLALREYERESDISTASKQEQKAISLPFLEKICAGDAHLGASFARIHVAWSNPFTALVPKRLYDDEHKATYLQYLVSPEGEWTYAVDDLPHFEACNVYAIEREGLAWCQKQFPGSKLVHITTTYLSAARNLAANPQGVRRLFVHTEIGRLRLALLDENRLFFSNTYTYQTAKDFLYFVLALVDEFDLDQETTPVLLSGQLMEDSEIYRLLYRYFRKLSFVSCPPQISPGAKSGALPQHLFSDLYFLALQTL